MKNPFDEDKQDRAREFMSAETARLKDKGFWVTNYFEAPNIDETGNLYCEVDDMLLGIEVTRIEEVDGHDEFVTYNRLYGETTFILWDEYNAMSLYATDDEIEANFTMTLVSDSIDGVWVHIDGSKGQTHYKAIMNKAHSLYIDGKLDYDFYMSAVRRYKLAVKTDEAKEKPVESFETIINEANKSISQEQLFRELARVNLGIIKTALANGRNTDFYTERIIRVGKDETSKAEDTESQCEACGKDTYFTVKVFDRRAAWCGCASYDDTSYDDTGEGK